MVHFGILSNPERVGTPIHITFSVPIRTRHQQEKTAYFPVSVAPLRRRAMVDRTVTAAGVLYKRTHRLRRERGEKQGGKEQGRAANMRVRKLPLLLLEYLTEERTF